MSLAALTIAAAGLLVGHDLPDETVDRGIQLILYKDRIEIDYQLDMNLKMVVKVLRREKQLPPDWKEADLDTPRVSELLPLIRLYMLNALREQLTVSINGEPQKIEAVRVAPAAIHTALLRATFRAKFQSKMANVKLEFADKNFREKGGWRRIAAKARPPVAIEQSSAEPILLRIKRDLTKPLTAEQLKKLQFAKVEFQIPDEVVVANSNANANVTPVPQQLDPNSTAEPVVPPQPGEPERTTSERPHPGWFVLAFLLMSALSAVVHRRHSRAGGTPALGDE